MERIRNTFERLREANRTAFIPFSVAGYPDVEQSREVFLSLARAGADILEVGLPFSDPIADGPVIQKASGQAIANGMNLDLCLETVAWLRERIDTPMVLMGYFNPIHRYGTKKFAAKAKECGIDGVLMVDVPLEESRVLKPVTDAAGLAWIYLATPTTPLPRVLQMDRDGSGFLYYVSVTGVTGARSALPAEIIERLDQIRMRCTLPLAVGFGVSAPEQASWLAPHVDGVVVGSALISRLENGDGLDGLEVWVREMKGSLEQKREQFVKSPCVP